MKSLHTRLDPQLDEVLKVTKMYGQFKAMGRFGVHSVSCFNQWLKEVTGDENFGIHPILSPHNRQSLGDQLVYAFLRKVASLEAENERLRQTIETLELQLSPAKETEELEAMAVMEVCQA